jgi:hypothetical protein
MPPTFVCQLGDATVSQLKTGDAQLVLMDVSGPMTASWADPAVEAG